MIVTICSEHIKDREVLNLILQQIYSIMNTNLLSFNILYNCLDAKTEKLTKNHWAMQLKEKPWSKYHCNCQTKIINLAHGTENQQTWKALFKTFTQICDALQSSDTLSLHFGVFLGCKGIHNLKIIKDFQLEITAHHSGNYILVIQIIQKIFCF